MSDLCQIRSAIVPIPIQNAIQMLYFLFIFRFLLLFCITNKLIRIITTYEHYRAILKIIHNLRYNRAIIPSAKDILGIK